MRKIYTIYSCLFAIMCIFACNNKNNYNPISVEVTKSSEINSLKKVLVDSCDVDLTCIEKLDESNGYYWCIYSNPDQFDTDLCCTLSKETYNKLFDIMVQLSKCNVNAPEYDEILHKNKFHILYGHIEKTILE